MKVQVLGSGTIVPSAFRSAAAYAVTIGERTILLDMGPGLLRRMAEAGIEINGVDMVFLSHFHPDHIGDFVPFVFASKYQIGPAREKDLTILAGVGFGELYNGLVEVYGKWIIPESYEIHIEEMGVEVREFDRFSVSTTRTNHNPESIAVRIDSEGRSLVYTGDTDLSESLIEISEGADLLIIETSFPDGMKVPGHLTPGEAAGIAARAKVKRVMPTHFYPPMEDVDLAGAFGGSFEGEVIRPRDLMVIDI
ncbi:MAG: MBL fold metallo-hydrolase [Deltaproteobacteria bacterium]|uniref:MBL fold metallo-hydrolase n=1 Tax=Candidatus Zymogenus saltonus TaxID=2844893 RepID=A0A9D8KHF5_9DELT|nr:MBL fold metallo-hydrolase [Candidatus Zymogenus saltonus]